MNLETQHRLTWILAVASGVLLLAVLALWLGVGRGYGWHAPDGASAPRLPDPVQLQRLSFEMPSFDHYVEITQRPLFADDRKPVPPDEAGDGPGAEEQAAPPVPLSIALTGVVITPEVKVALLRDLSTNKSVSVREGMPLPGNQTGWTLVEIHPRKVVVSDAGDKKTDVELTPPGSNPAAPGQNATPAAAAQADAGAAVQQPATAQEKAAADLRARIEARRQELREQAEKLRQQRAANEKTQ